MVVYIEYAIAENFLLDGLLLYAALKCAHAEVSVFRLALASALGAAEGVCFPLVAIPNFCLVLVKLLGGGLLCLTAVKRGKMRTYLAATAIFFALTFLFGGLLNALGSPFWGGEGTFPAAFVLGGAAVCLFPILHGAKALYRYAKTERSVFPCTLLAGGRKAKMRGFWDTGNCLYFRGEPVCVISAIGALALFSGQAPLGRMKISTVNGSKESPVFRCEEMTIGQTRKKNVCFTVGEIACGDYQIILHTSLSEGADESTVVS